MDLAIDVERFVFLPPRTTAFGVLLLYVRIQLCIYSLCSIHILVSPLIMQRTL